MPRTASAGVRHRLCRGVTHPPQPEQLRRVRDFPARRCRCGARLRLWQIRLQRGHPPVRGSWTGGRQGGQRRTGGNHRLGASVSSRPAARVPSRKAHQGVFVLRLPRQRSPAHDCRRARHAGLPDEANARRARQEDRRTSEPHSCGLYRTDAQLLPAILQPAVPDPKDRELRHSRPLRPPAPRLFRREVSVEARTAHRAVLCRSAVHVSQLFRRCHQKDNRGDGEQPHPSVCHPPGQERTGRRRVRLPGVRPSRIRVSPALQPHVPKMEGLTPSEYCRNLRS